VIDKYIILDRNNTIGDFTLYERRGDVPLNPEIKDFLKQVRADGYKTILATNGSEDKFSLYCQVTGLGGLFDYCFGGETLFTGRFNKDIAVLEDRIAQGILQKAIMIGNELDILGCPVPIFQVFFEKRLHWDVWKVYSMLPYFFSESSPMENFDQLFNAGKPLFKDTDSDGWYLTERVRTEHSGLKLKLELHALSEKGEYYFQGFHPDGFDPKKYERRVIIIKR